MWGARGVRGGLHAAVHGLPHQPGGLWDGLYDEHRLLARPARRRPRRREDCTSTSSVLFGEEWPVLLLGGVGAVRRVPPADRPARVPGLGLRAVAGDLLVGGRAVRVARPAPAAAADPAGRRRRAGAVGGARHEARPRRAGGRRRRRALRALASWCANVEYRADPRELLVSTQSSEEVKRVADQVVGDGRRKKPKLSVTIDSSDGATFPYAWYFRDLDGRLPRPLHRTRSPRGRRR